MEVVVSIEPATSRTSAAPLESFVPLHSALK